MRYALYLIGIVAIAYIAFISVSAPQYGAVASAPQILPNPTLTPGMTNPDITQATIGKTICNKNWSTKSIRPPTSYTSKLKITQIKQYGYSDTNPADYELDHLISLELGGNPTNPKNLWPQNYNSQPYNAHTKDKLENTLHSMVCSQQITLKKAQDLISTNWVAAYQQYVLTND